jgi:hypothetical protein
MITIPENQLHDYATCGFDIPFDLFPLLDGRYFEPSFKDLKFRFAIQVIWHENVETELCYQYRY